MQCPRLCDLVMLAPVALAATALSAQAAWLEVRVTGIPDDRGHLACSLHAEAAGFPEGPGLARQRVTPQGGQGLCRFDDVPPGRYAVAVMHDANDNGQLDVNLLGMPVEGWGVSGKAAPRLRPPRFDEAAFDIGADPGFVDIQLQP
ncbi:DUF2141 domain-containing protein [Paracoccus nototheniae]|uniref:DUF2141 domain-containing protein n=1 Tax=Paracoccus nototheniae TaxID=2489002 RepID=A0ABW4DSV0_9RHOB|nr:DUF2141 domain-containing protein [Paracoccus nototheniae]